MLLHVRTLSTKTLLQHLVRWLSLVACSPAIPHQYTREVTQEACLTLIVTLITNLKHTHWAMAFGWYSSR